MKRFLPLFFLLVPGALAQPLEALNAYEAGEFNRAAEYAQTSDSADDLAFAARAVLAGAMSTVGGEPGIEQLKRAEALARQALEIESRHAEGRLQLAISLSLQARPMSNRRVMRTGLGKKAKELADTILSEDPENTYAHGLLAVWNIEVLRRGGRIGARIMGASRRAGREHYEAATLIAPDDGALHWQWARVLAATNARKFRDEINTALKASIAAKTDDALERTMQDRAAMLLEAMQTGTSKEVQALAASLL